ncbi:hypothetical protein, partial [Pseudomonas sp. LAMO17WK12:I10]|uniref:hypothetical protein n=1 Tax=Pseudomonas sp. LAMO17WK12:I10 TaxID=1286371 RepID=UPI001959CE98
STICLKKRAVWPSDGCAADRRLRQRLQAVFSASPVHDFSHGKVGPPGLAGANLRQFYAQSSHNPCRVQGRRPHIQQRIDRVK